MKKRSKRYLALSQLTSWRRVLWSELKAQARFLSTGAVTCFECHRPFFREVAWEKLDKADVLLCTGCFSSWRVMIREYFRRCRRRNENRKARAEKWKTDPEFAARMRARQFRGIAKRKEKSRRRTLARKAAREVRERLRQEKLREKERQEAEQRKAAAPAIRRQLLIDAYGEEWVKRQEEKARRKSELAKKAQPPKVPKTPAIEKYRTAMAQGIEIPLHTRDRFVVDAIVALGDKAYTRNIIDEVVARTQMPRKRAERLVEHCLDRLRKSGVVEAEKSSHKYKHLSFTRSLFKFKGRI